MDLIKILLEQGRLNMEDLDYNLYVLAELMYRKTFSDVKEEDLYSQDWFT